MLTLVRGYSFCPLLMSMSEVSLSLLYFNKTLLQKSAEWSSLISGLRLNSSPPEAKNPGVFCGSSTTFGVITHLEPDILECKVKWALGSKTMSKASGGDGIPVELFQILKVMQWKCCTQYASNMENSAIVMGQEKVSFHSNPKER